MDNLEADKTRLVLVSKERGAESGAHACAGDWRADDRVWPEGRWESVFHMPGEWSGHWSVRCHNKLDERASCKLPKLLQCLKLCY